MGFFNGLLHTIFKSASVFLSGVQGENSYIYGCSAFLKLFTTLNPHHIGKLGRNGFFYRDDKDSGIADSYKEACFNDLHKLEKAVTKKIKTDGLYFCSPLLLDITGLDVYLLDNVDFSVRLEFASPRFIVNTHLEGTNFKLNIDLCKLWVTRLSPQPETLAALNTSFSEPGSFVEYVYNKQITQNGQNQNSVVVDIPWGYCIPNKICMIVDMGAYSGSYDKNPLFLRHTNLNGLSVSLNGRTSHNSSVDLHKHFAPLYHYTLKALGIDHHHLISYDAVTEGRFIVALDLAAENVKLLTQSIREIVG